MQPIRTHGWSLYGKCIDLGGLHGDRLLLIGSPGLERADVLSVRAAIEMCMSTGNLKIYPALRVSDDGLTWTTPAAIGSHVLTANGVQYHSAFVDVTSTSNTKRLIQFGVYAVNTSGTAFNLCKASMQVDIRSA